MPASDPYEPRYARIADYLRQKIVSGAWAPGFRLPKETDLAAAHGVSRMTMNKVLTDLAKDGFLLRRKRHGTVVAQPRAQSAVMTIADLAQEVAALGLHHDWQLLDCVQRQPTQAEARALDFQPAADAPPPLLVHGLHMAAERPFCLEWRAISSASVPGCLDQEFSAAAPGPWLLQTMPFTTARHRIRATGATAAEARLLGLAPGAPCLEILRHTEIGAAWVTHVRLLYPGAAHQVVAEFSPG